MYKSHSYTIVWITFLIAICLSILPLPSWAIWFQPQWVLLVLIYWVMALPHRVNVGTAFLLGIIMDALGGTLLGAHALIFALIAYIIVKIYQRLRIYPIWQQSLFIFLFVFLYQISIYWLQILQGLAPLTWKYSLVVLSSGIIWPWIFIVLRDCRRRFRVA